MNTLAEAIAAAQLEADAHGIELAVGLQYNDEGAEEFGYCPATHAGPATVYDVRATVSPRVRS